MNNYERVVKVFRTVFEDEVDVSVLTPESHLREDAGINSIGMLYMAMALEEEFGIHFTNDDFPNLQTVQDVLDCIQAKL